MLWSHEGTGPAALEGHTLFDAGGSAMPRWAAPPVGWAHSTAGAAAADFFALGLAGALGAAWVALRAAVYCTLNSSSVSVRALRQTVEAARSSAEEARSEKAVRSAAVRLVCTLVIFMLGSKSTICGKAGDTSGAL